MIYFYCVSPTSALLHPEPGKQRSTLASPGHRLLSNPQPPPGRRTAPTRPQYSPHLTPSSSPGWLGLGWVGVSRGRRLLECRPHHGAASHTPAARCPPSSWTELCSHQQQRTRSRPGKQPWARGRSLRSRTPAPTRVLPAVSLDLSLPCMEGPTLLRNRSPIHAQTPNARPCSACRRQGTQATTRTHVLPTAGENGRCSVVPGVGRWFPGLGKAGGA